MSGFSIIPLDGRGTFDGLSAQDPFYDQLSPEETKNFIKVIEIIVSGKWPMHLMSILKGHPILIEVLTGHLAALEDEDERISVVQTFINYMAPTEIMPMYKDIATDIVAVLLFSWNQPVKAAQVLMMEYQGKTITEGMRFLGEIIAKRVPTDFYYEALLLQTNEYQNILKADNTYVGIILPDSQLISA
jgi:hypothetical protein